MKSFSTINFDMNKCKKELAEFGALLKSKSELNERRDILPFFNKRDQLSAFLGNFNTLNSHYDQVAHELSLFGDFTCDLATGDKANNAYCLVEFEDATQASLFQTTKRSRPDWSRRFEHGFSQLVDWMWKVDDQKHTKGFQHIFGSSTINFVPILVIGRSAFITGLEKDRYDWRRTAISIDGKHVICITYDELFEILNNKATFATVLAQQGAAATLVPVSQGD